MIMPSQLRFRSKPFHLAGALFSSRENMPLQLHNNVFGSVGTGGSERGAPPKGTGAPSRQTPCFLATELHQSIFKRTEYETENGANATISTTQHNLHCLVPEAFGSG